MCAEEGLRLSVFLLVFPVQYSVSQTNEVKLRIERFLRAKYPWEYEQLLC